MLTRVRVRASMPRSGGGSAGPVDCTTPSAGLMTSPGHRSNLEAYFYDSVGIAVVRGPLGLMVVHVFMS